MAIDLNYEPNVLVEDITALSEEEWLEWRKKGIGGSDVAAVLGISPWKSGRELFYEKIGRKPVIEEDMNWVALEVGHRLEDLVAEIYRRKTGYKVYPIRKILQHPLYPFMIADVDFFVEKPNGRRGILETKTSHLNNIVKWKDGQVPRHYELQGKHYLSVANVDFAAFACLFSNNEADFVYQEVDRDLDEEEITIQELSYFWNTYVVPRQEPPLVEAADLCIQALRKYISPSSSTTPFRLPRVLQPSLEQILQLKDEKSRLEREVRALDERIQKLYVPVLDAMGSNTSAVYRSGGDQYSVTYLPNIRTSIKKEARERLQKEHPDIYDDYVSVSESRTFVLKKTAI